MKVPAVLAALACALLVGCATAPEAIAETPSKASAPKAANQESPKSSEKEEAAKTSDTDKSGEAKMAASQTNTPADGDEVAVLTTNHGTIVVMFRADKAPNHVANFVDLAKEGFYDGTKFHRVIPGFMIQGGDPNSKDNDRMNDGTGGKMNPDGSERTVKAEFNDLEHKRGVLSMARSQNPNSASSQFFIVVRDSPHLNGQYSAFGAVVSGLEVVDKIVNLPRDERDNPNPENPAVLEKVEIKTWPLEPAN